MHARDPSLDDCAFLEQVDDLVARDDTLLGTDFIGVPRYVFYLDHSVEGYLVPDRVPPPPGERSAYILARAWQTEHLKHLGSLQLVAQSRHTRKETGPHDRYTLYRILPAAASAAGPPRR
jgi:hypothetical protein